MDTRLRDWPSARNRNGIWTPVRDYKSPSTRSGNGGHRELGHPLIRPHPIPAPIFVLGAQRRRLDSKVYLVGGLRYGGEWPEPLVHERSVLGTLLYPIHFNRMTHL